MDFFSRQDEAQRRTLLLLILFPIAVMFLMAAAVGVYLVGTVFSMYWVFIETPRDPYLPRYYWMVAGMTLAVVMGGSFYRMRILAAGGGRRVAMEMGGRLIESGSAQPDERRLLNVVEEMAIASSLPVPEVYVLDGQEGINAFAAGLHPREAVVAVTSGCLRQLQRDELQGVIAHEFSHILQGDMRLNMILMGVLYGIELISLAGSKLAESSFGGNMSSRQAGDGALGIIFGYLLWIAGYLGLFMARVIKGAVSRQREYFADAAAVRFTRDTSGLARALMKIGGFSMGAVVHHAGSEHASHLFFGEGLGRRNFFDWTASHPPLQERIRRLYPAFAGEFPKLYGTDWVGWPDDGRLLALAPVDKNEVSQPSPVVRKESAPTRLQHAASYLEALPEEMAVGLRQGSSAMAMVCGLLVDRRQDVAHAQMEMMRGVMGDHAVQQAVTTAQWLVGCGGEWRLPLVDLAIPALRSLPHSQSDGLLQLITALARADQHISLFEYVLSNILRRALNPSTFSTINPTQWWHSYRNVAKECGALLSIMAYAGSKDDTQAQLAFQQAIAKLGGAIAPQMLAREVCSLKILDQALHKLAWLSPNFKNGLIKACCACIATDGGVTPRQAEVLRVVCDVLDCPVPPLAPVCPVPPIKRVGDMNIRKEITDKASPW